MCRPGTKSQTNDLDSVMTRASHTLLSKPRSLATVSPLFHGKLAVWHVLWVGERGPAYMPVFEESFKLSNQNPDHPQLIQVCSDMCLHHSHKSAHIAFQHWHASCIAMVLRFRKDCWPGTSLTSHAELTWCSQSVINDDRQSASLTVSNLLVGQAAPV